MKKLISFITLAIILVIFLSAQIFSRSVFDAGVGQVWSTATGENSADGAPHSKAVQNPETGGVRIEGGCDPAPGLCWEVAEGGRKLIVYDLVIGLGSGGMDLYFNPVPVE